MARASQQALFPDNAYSVDSGGIPRPFPNWVSTSSSSSTASSTILEMLRVYFYGDDDPAARLDLLEEYRRSLRSGTSRRKSKRRN